MKGSRPRAMSGTANGAECDTSVNYNKGCGVEFNKPASYGKDFNALDGGWYVYIPSYEPAFSLMARCS
jgi:hypothetical protein